LLLIVAGFAIILAETMDEMMRMIGFGWGFVRFIPLAWLKTPFSLKQDQPRAEQEGTLYPLILYN